MTGDFRETLIGCSSTMCRFNIAGSTERTCMLKLVAIDDTGRCRMAEGKQLRHPEGQPSQKIPGHYEGGKWIP